MINVVPSVHGFEFKLQKFWPSCFVFFGGGGGGNVGGSIDPLKNRLHRKGGVFYDHLKRDSFRFP